MRQQPIEKKQTFKSVDVVDNRPPRPATDPGGTPIRTILYMEVNDMPRDRVLHLIRQVSAQYEAANPGTHYVLPIRHGKISSDVLFEQEWLDIVRKTCEIQDGVIVLKNGAQEVRVVRETV